MQATREQILHILKEREQATVDELSRELGLTPVTVRHHLDILRGEGLVAAPIVRRRKAPGRPQHVYALTELASAHFPKNYDHLASLLLREIRLHFSPEEADQMMKNIGRYIAGQATLPEIGDFPERVAATVAFLTDQGYLARWEAQGDDGYLLHIANCPYERVAAKHQEVCAMDVALLTHLLGTTPERIKWSAKNERQCTYAVHPPSS